MTESLEDELPLIAERRFGIGIADRVACHLLVGTEIITL